MKGLLQKIVQRKQLHWTRTNRRNTWLTKDLFLLRELNACIRKEKQPKECKYKTKQQQPLPQTKTQKNSHPKKQSKENQTPENSQEILRGTLATSVSLILFRESIKANHEEFWLMSINRNWNTSEIFQQL